MANVEKADAGAHSTGDDLPCVQWLGLKSNIIGFDHRQHFVLRWEMCVGFYLIGPFETCDAAADWGRENEGLSPCWQVVRTDPNYPLSVVPPGEIPEYEPGPYDPDFDDPRRWRPPQGATGAFHLLMSADLYLVGPFACDRDAFVWGKENERRTDEGDWWVVWVEDLTAKPTLLTPEQGVIETERHVAAEMRERDGDFED